jgi:hypothetical protein
VIVGLIANPNASKDIRRLVGLARVVDTEEKANLVARLLSGMAVGPPIEVHALDDHSGLTRRALRLTRDRSPSVEWLPVRAEGTERDTRRAAGLVRERGGAFLVVVGGDGTIRAAVEAWPEAPLVPLAAGTNNALALRDEPTVVGLAIARAAAGAPLTRAFRPCLRLVVDLGGSSTTAVVDVVGVRRPWTGTGALWEPDDLVEAVVTTARPTGVGLSSVAAGLGPLPPGKARYMRFGPGESFRAVFGPGLVSDFSVAEHRLMSTGVEVRLHSNSRVVAFDGERKVVTKERPVVRVAPGPQLFAPSSVLDGLGPPR